MLKWVIGQLLVAAAIWGGIRVDIRAIHEHMKRIQRTADTAHMRIDRHLEASHLRATEE
jgi:hypothetical protein